MGGSTDSRRQPANSQLMVPSRLLRQAAGTIRSLDSRLERICFATRSGGPVLMYTFTLAGREESFAVVVEQVMVSVADLYPAAAPLEAELARLHGIVFRQPEEVGGS